MGWGLGTRLAGLGPGNVTRWVGFENKTSCMGGGLGMKLFFYVCSV